MSKIRIPLADLGAQYRQVEGTLAPQISELMVRGDYVGSSIISEFEERFASYTNSKYCVAVGNGTDALEILLSALQFPKGSTVLVQDNSFVATAEAVINSGLNLKLVDIDSDFQISRSSLQSNLDDSVVAVVITHLYGYPNSALWIQELIAGRNTVIIEDCAQAHGSMSDTGMHVGNAGVGGAFSFYPGKNLGAAGDGGAIVTNSPSIAERARILRNHGRRDKFDHDVVGRNSRLDSLQALILLHKLEKLDAWLQIRRQNAKYYEELLRDLPLRLPNVAGKQSSFHQYVIMLEHRDELRAHLASVGIETGIHYPRAISDYAPYSQYFRGSSRAARLSRQLLSLPVGEHLTNSHIAEVSRSIRDFFSRGTDT